MITTRNRNYSASSDPTHAKPNSGARLECRIGRLRRCEAALAAPVACFLTLQVGLGVFLLCCGVVWHFVLAHHRIAQECVGDLIRLTNTPGLIDFEVRICVWGAIGVGRS